MTDSGRPSRPDSSDEAARMFREWALTATTDLVPDYYKDEALPDGTVADRPWWFHDDLDLRDYPPDWP